MLDLASMRYTVTIADGNDSVKKLKAENLEFVKRFVRPLQMLSTHRRPFKWDDIVTKLQGRSHRSWAAQLALIRELGLPAPSLATGEALAKFAKSPVAEA